MNIGERLKILRIENEYSQADFADKLNVSLSAYKSYEINKTSVPHTVLMQLKTFTNVSLDWLVSGESILEDVNTSLEAYLTYGKKHHIISVPEVFKRLLENTIDKKDKNKDKLHGYIEKNDFENICSELGLIYEGIDFMNYYKNDKIPYGIIFFENTHNAMSIEWFLYGIWDLSKDIRPNAEIIQEIENLLSYVSPNVLRAMKTKLESIMEIENDMFK